MEKLYISGGNRLDGEVKIGGMKNSALPIIYACLLIKDECIIKNVPLVSDIENSLKILRSMGAIAEICDNNTVLINTKYVTSDIKENHLVSKMRASSYLMGAMLSRFKEVSIPLPGGCNFGTRPLDLHFKGFKELGADVYADDSIIHLKMNTDSQIDRIKIEKISVGATINMILSLAIGNKMVIIENAAKEPHVDDLIRFLNLAGAKIKRCGNEIICKGVSELHGVEYRIYSDMIEALTYITFVGICNGKIELIYPEYEHIFNEIKIFNKMNFKFKKFCDRIVVEAGKNLWGTDVVTAPYPKFPTDLHPQFSALLCYTNGEGSVQDDIFPTRFAYVNELNKMGAKIEKIENKVLIKKSALHCASLDATDLRAGAALVAAALGAEGDSVINNVNYIVRGYESIVQKVSAIGGKIKLL